MFIPVLIGLCSYKNVLAIWGHSRWKLTLAQIVSLRAFSFVFTAILNSQAGCRCTLVPRLLFPVPRSPFPFPVPGISNIHNLARALVRVKSSSPVKLSFRFWSLAGEGFKCRQTYFNTVIYEGCSSRLLLFHVQTRRTNWVSVVWKLG